MKYFLIIISVVLSGFTFSGKAQEQLKIAQLQYNGGGDWYANPTGLKNLIQFCNQQLNTNIQTEYDYVMVGSSEIYQYPFIHMTGHGNVVFSSSEADNLRNYLINGGFLHIDDNYGLDQFIRLEMKKVFPNKEWVELPANHPIYNAPFKMQNGLPKIHEHDGNPAQGLALMHEGKVIVYYTYECDLSDGWEDASVHNDPENIRKMAFEMGSNILQYAFTKPLQINP